MLHVKTILTISQKRFVLFVSSFCRNRSCILVPFTMFHQSRMCACVCVCVCACVCVYVSVPVVRLYVRQVLLRTMKESESIIFENLCIHIHICINIHTDINIRKHVFVIRMYTHVCMYV